MSGSFFCQWVSGSVGELNFFAPLRENLTIPTSKIHLDPRLICSR